MGKLHGPGDVAGPIRGNPVWVLGCLEQADADAAGVPITGSRDDRDAHPERFAGRRGAVIGKRVEGDVDPPVGREVLGDGWRAPEELDTVGGEACLSEPAVDVCLEDRHFQSVAFEEESGLGDLGEEFGPDGEHLVGDLGEVVETAESDVAGAGAGWRGGLGGGLWGA